MKKALQTVFMVTVVFLFCGYRPTQSVKTETVHDTVYLEKERVVYKTKVKRVPTQKVQVNILKAEKPKFAPANYTLSENGLNLIKQNEGCKNEVYKDRNGKSIGYGHYLQTGENFTKITNEQIDSLFKNDIAQVERSINKLLKQQIDTKGYVFSQNFIDGFGDLLYNCGHGNVEKSPIYQSLKNNVRWDRPDKVDADIRFVASKVRTWSVTVKAHKERRLKEQVLMAN